MGVKATIHRTEGESKLKVILITDELVCLTMVPAGAPRYSELPASDSEAVVGG